MFSSLGDQMTPAPRVRYAPAGWLCKLQRARVALARYAEADGGVKKTSGIEPKGRSRKRATARTAANSCPCLGRRPPADNRTISDRSYPVHRNRRIYRRGHIIYNILMHNALQLYSNVGFCIRKRTGALPETTTNHHSRCVQPRISRGVSALFVSATEKRQQ